MTTGLQQLLTQAAETLKSFGAREVYVFGSAASGTMRPDSDIDLAVSGLPPEVFFRAMAATEEMLRRSVDLLDLDEQSPLGEYLRTHGALQRVA